MLEHRNCHIIDFFHRSEILQRHASLLGGNIARLLVGTGVLRHSSRVRQAAAGPAGPPREAPREVAPREAGSGTSWNSAISI